MTRRHSPLTAAIAAALIFTTSAIAQRGYSPRGPSYGAPRRWAGAARPRPPGDFGPGAKARYSAGWDPTRHNGFWRAGRWYYGPPPPAFGPGEVTPGRAAWRRGAAMPDYYHDGVVEDFARYRLRRPPPGYHWVRAGGDFVLVSGSTGLIFDVVPGE